VGMVAGAALGAANWAVNHREENWVSHVVSGAIHGAISGASSLGIAKFAQARFSVARSHRMSGGGLRARYVNARRSFSTSKLWAAKRYISHRKQLRFTRRYR
jgi:hypothetical protein